MKVRESSVVMQRTLVRKFLVAGGGILSGVLLIARTTVGANSGGDIAVWIFVHEWIDRGATLYAGVWDHKDWGFFAITQPFYHFAGTTGLYVSGLIASLLFATGVYLSVREVVNRNKAVIITSTAAAIYVLSPSFLSTYTENYAIAFAVLGVGLLSRRPFSAGVVFALSALIKISGLSLFLLVLSVFVFMSLTKSRQEFSSRFKNCLRSIFGFGLLTTIAVSVAATQGSLPGWIDVITYNFEYGAIRRMNKPTSPNLRPTLDSLLPTAIFLAVIISAAVCALVLLVLQSRKRTLETNSFNGLQCLMLNGALVAASVIVLATQYPPSFQHYQYLVGPVVSTVAVLVAMIWSLPHTYSGKVMKVSVLVLSVPLLVGGSIAVRLDGPGFIRSNLLRWGYLDRDSQVVGSLDQIPANSSLAFVDVGGWLVNLNSIPDSATLNCPFFYQVPHLLPRYGQKIITCLQTEPDFVVLKLNNYTDQEFRNKVLDVLENQFVNCSTEDSIFELWSRRATGCPSE